MNIKSAISLILAKNKLEDHKIIMNHDPRIPDVKFDELMKREAMRLIDRSTAEKALVKKQDIIEVLKTGEQYKSFSLRERLKVERFLEDSSGLANKVPLCPNRLDLYAYTSEATSTEERRELFTAAESIRNVRLETDIAQDLARHWMTNTPLNLKEFIFYVDVTQQLASQSEALAYLSSEQHLALAVGYKLYCVSHWSLTNEGSFFILLKETRALFNVHPIYTISMEVYNNKAMYLGGVTTLTAVCYTKAPIVVLKALGTLIWKNPVTVSFFDKWLIEAFQFWINTILSSSDSQVLAEKALEYFSS